MVNDDRGMTWRWRQGRSHRWTFIAFEERKVREERALCVADVGSKSPLVSQTFGSPRPSGFVIGFAVNPANLRVSLLSDTALPPLPPATL